MEKPPYSLTSKILNLVSSIQEIIGELKGDTLAKPPLKLRKANKIKTVHHSLAIEGNALTEEQITAILENKRVLGPKDQITEVLNALTVYETLSSFDPLSEKDLLSAHKILMKDLVKGAGKYRNTQVGIFKGSKVSHVAPPAKQLPHLMTSLFKFLSKDKETSWLIKACVFHYELEFIHPFEDGNGRMGRLWQQLILMKQSPVFEYISTETLIHKKQFQYYKILEKCDSLGDSTPFVEFSLENILLSLEEFKGVFRPTKLTASERMQIALENFGSREFSRKDYLALHKSLSTATGSRDLASAIEEGLVSKEGDKANTIYRKKKPLKR